MSARKGITQGKDCKPGTSENREGFLLDCTRRIHWKRLPDRGWFAVFDDLPSPFLDFHRVFVTNGTKGLRRGLKRHLKSGIIRNPSCVSVETASSESALTDPDYQRMVSDILLGIDAIKRRGDQKTILAIRAAISRKGVKPGPKHRQDTSLWKIETLWALAAGGQLKASVAQAKRTPPSASAELSRFCRDFYESCCRLGMPTPDLLRGYVAGVLGESFGFQFPRDVEAAREAHRRGKKSADRAR